MRFLRLPANLSGRDFIVGDIHGCYSSLLQLLDEAKFDYALDRLFSVGDIIDRGPDSEKCLQLISESWFYMVPGNHEKMFRDAASRNITFMHWDDYFSPRIGGLWAKTWFDTNAPDLAFWAHELSQLPFVIAVDGAENRSPFWVVHAELRSRTSVLVPTTVQEHVEQASREDIDIFQWKRKLIYHQHVAHAPILNGPIYCGHTPVRNPPLLQYGHCYMDGGAGKLPDPNEREASVLTLVCHNNGTVYSTQTA